MQIHELNNYTGALNDAYMAVDDGSDTGKEKVKDITDPLNARIDNIIAGDAPSAAEIIDARLGADGVTYPSLGDAIRDQVAGLQDAIDEIRIAKPNLFHLSNTSLNHLNVGTNNDGTIFATMAEGYSTITSNTRFNTITLPAGTYTASMEAVSGTGADYGMYLQEGANVIVRLDAGTPVTFTLNAETTIQLSFAKNNAYNFTSVKIMINSGSDSMPWTAYGYTANDETARALISVNASDITALETEQDTLDFEFKSISNKMGMSIGAETTIPEHESGKYVYTATMAIASSVAFSYSDAIPVKKGDVVYANLAAQTGVVEAIAYCNNDLTQFSHGVTGVDPIDGTTSDYWLLVDHDGYICFSYQSNPVVTHIYRIISFSESDKYIRDILCTFDNITCIGDSLTAGVVYTAAGNNWRLAYVPYPKVLQRKTGAAATILASGGYSASDAWTMYGSSITAKTNQLTIIYLGTNDGLTDTMDTDMIGNDYTQWGNTNTACYGKLIAKSLDVGSRILLVKIYESNVDVDTTNLVIDKMAARFNVAVIGNTKLTELKYHSYPDGSGYNSLHYNDLGYAVFAEQLMYNVGVLGDLMAKRLIPQ